MVNEKLKFYLDTIVVETLLSDPRMVKQAQSGIISSLIHTVYNYVNDKMQNFKGENSTDKVDTVVNFMAPGILSALGSPALGTVLWAAEHLFHFNLGAILRDIASEVKGLITGGKQTNSSEVRSAVIKSVLSNAPPDTAGETQSASDMKVSSLSLREAELFKIAFAEFAASTKDWEKPGMSVRYAAGLFHSPLTSFISSKHKTTRILVTVLSWLATAVLASAGFMVAGDVIHAVVGKASTVFNGESAGPDTSTSSVPAAPPQTKYKVSPSYSEEYYNGPNSRWIISGNISSIPQLLVSWATEIYPELRGHENEITSSSAFNAVVNVIDAYNKGGNSGTIFFPTQWHSRKDVVDNFVSSISVAATTPQTGTVSQTPNYVPPASKQKGINI